MSISVVVAAPLANGAADSGHLDPQVRTLAEQFPLYPEL